MILFSGLYNISVSVLEPFSWQFSKSGALILDAKKVGP